jgi:hypothetical protein
MGNAVEGNAPPLNPLASFSKRMLHTFSDLLLLSSPRRSRRCVNRGEEKGKKEREEWN